MANSNKVKTMNDKNATIGNDGENANRKAPGVSGSLGSLSVLMALEPRFMFDAAVAAEVVEVATLADSHSDAGIDSVDDGSGGDSDGEAFFSNNQEQTFARPMAFSPYGEPLERSVFSLGLIKPSLAAGGQPPTALVIVFVGLLFVLSPENTSFRRMVA